MSLSSDSIGTYIIAGYEDTGHCLKQRKEETTAVGTLHLLDHDVRHDHLQCTLQSSAHASNRSARVQLSSHSNSSSPRLTPSPSPRANQIPLPSGPQTSRESMYDASISGTGASGKGPGTYSARGSSILSPRLLTAVNTRSAAARPDFRRIFSPSPRSACTRGIPSPTSRSRSHVSTEIRKGQPSLSPVSKRIVQFCEGPPDTHLASDERCNGEHDDEDEDGDSNAHSGSSTRNPPPTPGMVFRLGLSNMGPVAVGELKVINVRRRVTEQDVMWTDLVWDVLKESAADFGEMPFPQMAPAAHPRYIPVNQIGQRTIVFLTEIHCVKTRVRMMTHGLTRSRDKGGRACKAAGSDESSWTYLYGRLWALVLGCDERFSLPSFSRHGLELRMRPKDARPKDLTIVTLRGLVCTGKLFGVAQALIARTCTEQMGAVPGVRILLAALHRLHAENTVVCVLNRALRMQWTDIYGFLPRLYVEPARSSSSPAYASTNIARRIGPVPSSLDATIATKGPMFESPKSNTIPGCGDGFIVEEPSTPAPRIAVNASGVDRGGGGRSVTVLIMLNDSRERTSDYDAEGERPSGPELDPEPDSESEPECALLSPSTLVAGEMAIGGVGLRWPLRIARLKCERERLVGLGIRRLHEVVRGEGEKPDAGCRWLSGDAPLSWLTLADRQTEVQTGAAGWTRDTPTARRGARRRFVKDVEERVPVVKEYVRL
ncbi:hypothetical protein BU17DRAFT_60441 [Hysterangium stoloniferum]|nr:hypothetical protein BU17DRAFT_60441 [Hysterangium stoloniferum]